MTKQERNHFRPHVILFSVAIIIAPLLLSPYVTNRDICLIKTLARFIRDAQSQSTVTLGSSVTPKSAHSLMQGDSPLPYVDVRTPEEFGQGHVPKAVNVPVTLGAGPLAGFVADMEKLYAKDTQLLVGCKSGKRSSMAIELLKEAGFSNLVEIEGGFDAWKGDSGLPTEV